MFPVGDAYYHLRRAEYTLEHPPDVLLFDPLVNHPDGAWIPWPPLHTLLLADVARALGGTKHDLELTGRMAAAGDRGAHRAAGVRRRARARRSRASRCWPHCC